MRKWSEGKMPSKPDCKFEPRYAENGSLFKGECACGQVFYPFSTDPKKREEALKYMEEQYREHHDDRYPKIDP
jgi:hypothetical protein